MYYSRLTVYKFSKNKLKVDYSVIPIKRISENSIKSEVSDQVITLNKKPYFRVKNSYTVSLISEELNEEKNLKELQASFNKHFWYKLKYKKFLAEKVNYILKGDK